MARVKVLLDLRGLERYRKEVRRGLRSLSPSPMRDVLKKWAFRYRGAMRQRYDRFSKGGGDWKPLKESTKKARRHGKGGRSRRGSKAYAKAKASGGGKISILRDTNEMFSVLSPVFRRLPGQSEQNVPFGIVVGFEGPGQKTQRDKKKGKATIREVAEFHHLGKGRNPKRTLLVDPDDPLKRKMANDMVRGMQEEIRQSQLPPQL